MSQPGGGMNQPGGGMRRVPDDELTDDALRAEIRANARAERGLVVIAVVAAATTGLVVAVLDVLGHR